MSSRARSYVEQVYADARALGYSDVQARTLAAQSALETAYGRSTPGNNLTGIKAGTSWRGPTHTVGTWEEENGRRVNQPGTFRSYDDPLDSLRDWGDVVGNRWSGVMTADTFPEAVASLRAGQPGGYATDSRYGAKLGYIDANFNTLKDFAAAIPTGIPNAVPQARPNPQSMPETLLSNAAPASLLDAPVEEAPSFSSLLTAYAPVEAPVSIANQPVAAPDFTEVSVSRNAFDVSRTAPQPLADAPVMAATAPMMAAPAAAAAFDMERFGPQPNMPSLPSIAQANIVGQPSIAAMTNVTAPNFAAAPASLLNTATIAASPLERSVAPLEPAVNVSAPPSVADLGPVPGYLDPMVTTAAAPAPAPAAVSAPPAVSASPTPAPSAVSAAPSAGPMVSVGVDGIAFDDATQAAAAQSRQVNSLLDDVQATRQRNAVIGSLLGTVALGPVGGLLGLSMANRVTNATPHAQALGAFPSAPSLAGRVAQAFGHDPGNGGYDGLSDYGKDAYSESGQFSDAVNSGDAGLW